MWQGDKFADCRGNESLFCKLTLFWKPGGESEAWGKRRFPFPGPVRFTVSSSQTYTGWELRRHAMWQLWHGLNVTLENKHDDMIDSYQSGFVESTFREFLDQAKAFMIWLLPQFIIKRNHPHCVHFTAFHWDRLWAFTRMTQSPGPINPLVRWLSAARYKNQKPGVFPPLPEERCQHCSHSTSLIVLPRIAHGRFHSRFHQREVFS